MENNLLNKYLKNPENLNEESLVKIHKLTEEFPFSQTFWMLYLKNLKVINHPDYQTELQRIAIRVADRKRLFNFLQSSQNNKSCNIEMIPGYEIGNSQTSGYFEDTWELESGLKGNDLIDNFIARQPSIRLKTQGNITNPNDFSEASISENDEIITETFANILVQQKKWDKAIESFEKLSLKFPEKSIYFAGRIEEINEVKNN